MIYIGQYEELVPGRGYPSMRDCFEAGEYTNKEKIIHYLRTGKIDMVSMARAIDVLTGELIPWEKLGMSDGKYMWWNTLAYYVEKYNLRLPEAFEKHILEKTQE